MTGAELSSKYPRLYHMATAGALPQIEKYGLLSTEATLDLLKIDNQLREQLLSMRRPKSVVLERPNIGRFVLRDQIPMRDSALASCLIGMKIHEWYRLLNERVFMWASRERVETLLAARAYRKSTHLILTIDTTALLAKYEAALRLSPINSGATLYVPPPRGAFTFSPLADYETVNGKRPVVEATIKYSIPDFREFVVSSETRQAEG